RVDLDNTRHRSELVVDVPVQNGAQLHRRVAGVRIWTPWRARRLGLHLELVDLAEAGRDRAHLRLAVALGDRLTRLRQALAHHLAAPVDVGALFEDDGYDREPELRDRADLLDLRQAAHRGLHRERDEPLDLLWREAG